MRKQRVTMKDIAAAAEVSIGVVSAVMSGGSEKIFFGEETRERVLDAVTRLGYRRNVQAQALRSGRTYSVGVALDDITVAFLTQVIHAIGRELAEHRYSLTLFDFPRVPASHETFEEMYAERRVDGFIVAGAAHALDDDGVRALAAFGAPVVLVERDLDHSAVPCVVVDNVEGGRLAGQHLARLGRRRPACITGPADAPMARDRLAGFRAASGDSGIRLVAGRIVEGDWTMGSGHAQMAGLLRRKPIPDAVFAGNDMMAIGALRAIHEAGLRVPEDIAVVGFDDLDVAAFNEPSLTTIRQPAVELGRHAVRLLRAVIEGKPSKPSKVLLSPELVVRQSA